MASPRWPGLSRTRPAGSAHMPNGQAGPTGRRATCAQPHSHHGLGQRGGAGGGVNSASTRSSRGWHRATWMSWGLTETTWHRWEGAEASSAARADDDGVVRWTAMAPACPTTLGWGEGEGGAAKSDKESCWGGAHRGWKWRRRFGAKPAMVAVLRSLGLDRRLMDG
jgi:hypothetical protein